MLLEKGVDGHVCNLFGEVGPERIGSPLLVVVHALFFAHPEKETTDGHLEFFGDRGVPLPHILRRVRVVNNHRLPLLKPLPASFQTLFDGLQGVVVNPSVL